MKNVKIITESGDEFFIKNVKEMYESTENSDEYAKKKTDWKDGSIFDIKEFDEYYSLDYFGCVSTECYTGNNDDYDAIDFGNACKDKEYMQSMLRKIKLYNYLSNFAEVVNEGWKPNWGNIEEKWYIFYINSSKKWDASYLTANKVQNVTYFKSRELAQRAIDEIILPFERGEL